MMGGRHETRAGVGGVARKGGKETGGKEGG